MQAWVLIKHGDPATAFELRTLPDPVVGPAQVLIHCEGSGLNFADTMARQGLYREAPPLPSVLGYEVVGEIRAVGKDVDRSLVGQRVIAFTRFGGYAELVATDHRAIAIIPKEMDMGKATALATQYVTAWYASNYAVMLRNGQRVLVHSAAGGVGQALVQMALNKGCEVFGIASGAAKMEFLKRMGVQHTIDRKAMEYADAARHMLAGRRLDVSFNAVAGRTFKKDMELLGSGGAIVLFGGAQRAGKGGGILTTLKFAWDMGVVVPIFLMMRSKSVVGINMLKMGDYQPELVSRCMAEVVAEAVAGNLDPHVHAVLPKEQLPQAHEMLSAGGTMGKVVIRW